MVVNKMTSSRRLFGQVSKTKCNNRTKDSINKIRDKLITLNRSNTCHNNSKVILGLILSRSNSLGLIAIGK